MTISQEKQKQVGFKVAAKTARLIGRDSVSSAEGAVIELVKNSYDADAKKCCIYIINKYEKTPKILTARAYQSLIEDSRDNNLLEECYSLNGLGDAYTISGEISTKQRYKLESLFSSYNRIIIADNGEGMTAEIIQNHWMTIGTNAKEVTAVSEHGRIRSGAKGIGRFALDKLGKTCEMFTQKDGSTGCHWVVNWEDFEGKSTLDEVKALLSESKVLFTKKLLNILGKEQTFYENDDHGTLICIGNLREFWPKSRISKLHENLKSLLPPIEESGFTISLHANLYPDDFGELSSSDYNEYDWKLSASIINGQVEMTFYPAEYDKASFDSDFFEHKLYKEEKHAFTKEEFLIGKYKKSIKLSSLVPSAGNEELSNALHNLGELNFSTYFLKKSSSADDREKYYYKDVNQGVRNKWLHQNGGVKIYRDNMRVRPYGIGSSFDWLKLDERASASPAAPNRKGQWRVRAHQLAGIAHISRVTNPNILDQSNREGLIENKSLGVFKNVLIALIKELEYQRSFVASVMFALHREKNIAADIVEKSDTIIKTHKPSATKEESLFSSVGTSEDEEKVDVLVQRAKIQDEKIDNLSEENKLLRVLASSGAMIASFAHDFKKMSTNLSSRHGELIAVLKTHDLYLEGLDESINPFSMIKDMENQDHKLSAWLRLTLDTLKQDRRKSKRIVLGEYFDTLKLFWLSHLEARNATLSINVSKTAALRCFEIELDAIFNNLIANSYEAFARVGFQGEKKIIISAEQGNNQLMFIYEDTGPGLSSDIQTSNQIFEPLFTTKKDSNGNPIGTGLGMSLVKGSVDDLLGSARVLSNIGNNGFKLEIIIPCKNMEK